MGRHSKVEDLVEENMLGAGLDAHEKRSLVLSSAFRIAGTPVVAVAGLVSAGLTIRATGEAAYGLVTLVSTVGLLFPFADLGIGAVVINAASRNRDIRSDPWAIDVVRRAYRVLALIAGVLIVLALVIMALDGWGTLLGLSTGPNDRWAITIGVVLFALTIPAGLCLRILVGIDKNQLAVLVMVSNSVFGLALTAAMYASGVQGIWFVLPALGGALLGNLAGTVLALRISGLGMTAFERVTSGVTTRRLLEGTLWLFCISIGLPFGLQVQRVVLAHLSTPQQLSEYALMAQIYGIAWSVFSTAALSFWPVFVKRRQDPDGTLALWLKVTVVFGGVATVGAVPMVILSPWISDVLSGGEIDVTSALAVAFAVLLIMQCLHLPSGVLLVSPSEARWQTYCLAAMATASVVASVALAPDYGAVGVVFVTAAAVGACQFVPDLLYVPSLVRRREPVRELVSQ